MWCVGKGKFMEISKNGDFRDREGERGKEEDILDL